MARILVISGDRVTYQLSDKNKSELTVDELFSVKFTKNIFGKEKILIINNKHKFKYKTSVNLHLDRGFLLKEKEDFTKKGLNFKKSISPINTTIYYPHDIYHNRCGIIIDEEINSVRAIISPKNNIILINEKIRLEYNDDDSFQNDWDFFWNKKEENNSPKDIKIEKKLIKESKKGKNMFEKIKNQYEKYEDILFPLFVVIALDFLFNDGRFQKKVTAIVNALVDRVTGKITPALTEKTDD